MFNKAHYVSEFLFLCASVCVFFFLFFLFFFFFFAFVLFREQLKKYFVIKSTNNHSQFQLLSPTLFHVSTNSTHEEFNLKCHRVVFMFIFCIVLPITESSQPTTTDLFNRCNCPPIFELFIPNNFQVDSYCVTPGRM